MSEQHHRDGQERAEEDGREIPSTLYRTVEYTVKQGIKQVYIYRKSNVNRKRHKKENKRRPF